MPDTVPEVEDEMLIKTESLTSSYSLLKNADINQITILVLMKKRHLVPREGIIEELFLEE